MSISLKLVSMVQAIKDLANAFVPSGRLIELVDISLVCLFFLLNLFCCSKRLEGISTFFSLLSSAADGRHTPTTFW